MEDCTGGELEEAVGREHLRRKYSKSLAME